MICLMSDLKPIAASGYQIKLKRISDQQLGKTQPQSPSHQEGDISISRISDYLPRGFLASQFYRTVAKLTKLLARIYALTGSMELWESFKHETKCSH